MDFIAVPSFSGYRFANRRVKVSIKHLVTWSTFFSRQQQVEGKSTAEPEDLDEATLEGIPSVDFRPVLELFAPTGDKLRMSPCGECGGTMEVGAGLGWDELWLTCVFCVRTTEDTHGHNFCRPRFSV